jgi:hypothetical protein
MLIRLMNAEWEMQAQQRKDIYGSFLLSERHLGE